MKLDTGLSADCSYMIISLQAIREKNII